MANGEDPDARAVRAGLFGIVMFVGFAACLLGWVWNR